MNENEIIVGSGGSGTSKAIEIALANMNLTVSDIVVIDSTDIKEIAAQLREVKDGEVVLIDNLNTLIRKPLTIKLSIDIKPPIAFIDEKIILKDTKKESHPFSKFIGNKKRK